MHQYILRLAWPSMESGHDMLTLFAYLNNLEKKRILQKLKEPTVSENSKLGFIESVPEN